MHSTTILERARYYADDEATFNVIEEKCSHYMKSQVTLYKQMPSGTASGTRVKLRHRRGEDFHVAFNRCFDVTRLYERSLTCYTTMNRELEPGYDWFVVYPPNGFQYLYSPATDVSDLRDIDPKLIPQIVDLSFFSEQLQSHTYLDPEVMIFDIPSYYVVKADV